MTKDEMKMYARLRWNWRLELIREAARNRSWIIHTDDPRDRELQILETIGHMAVKAQILRRAAR